MCSSNILKALGLIPSTAEDLELNKKPITTHCSTDRVMIEWCISQPHQRSFHLQWVVIDTEPKTGQYSQNERLEGTQP